MQETPRHWTGPDRETFDTVKPVFTTTVSLRKVTKTYAPVATPVATPVVKDAHGPVLCLVADRTLPDRTLPEKRQNLWHKTRTQDAIVWRKDTWKTSDNDAIAESDLALASMTRRERRAARYLDLIAKGKLKP